MPNQNKHDRILDALQTLLQTRSLQTISVSEIAQTAEIGKGSIYYYFPSKDSIFEALIERSYEEPLKTAKVLADQRDISPFTRMAMIFQACRNSSSQFLQSQKPHRGRRAGKSLSSSALCQPHRLGTEAGAGRDHPSGDPPGGDPLDRPEALAEIVLIVLTIKLDNSIVETSKDEVRDTIAGLITLLEKGTENPPGSLNFLMAI